MIGFRIVEFFIAILGGIILVISPSINDDVYRILAVFLGGFLIGWASQ
ncbi:MAG: hypothetical protein AABY22_27485 [Nanoarchaeota archaeon]